VGESAIADGSNRLTGQAEGLYGLRRALVVAGSETQLTTLWKIDTNAGLQLLTGWIHS